MDELAKLVDDGLKRSTNLTLRTKLVRDARLLGINLSAAAEAGIESAIAKAREQEWVARNRTAMASYNAFVEREGLVLEDLRPF